VVDSERQLRAAPDLSQGEISSVGCLSIGCLSLTVNLTAAMTGRRPWRAEQCCAGHAIVKADVSQVVGLWRQVSCGLSIDAVCLMCDTALLAKSGLLGLLCMFCWL
jgi:hypothetical protein